MVKSVEVEAEEEAEELRRSWKRVRIGLRMLSGLWLCELTEFVAEEKKILLKPCLLALGPSTCGWPVSEGKAGLERRIERPCVGREDVEDERSIFVMVVRSEEDLGRNDFRQGAQ